MRDAHRDKLIGFGDPYFNLLQAPAAAQVAPAAAASQPPADQTSTDGPELAESPPAAAATRGPPLKLRSSLPRGVFDVNLFDLPRLPDTAEELRAIAAALGVDPTTTLKLGKDANERVVKATKLSGYRIVAFATHGLMADDIDGLDQPALALTSPRVAGISGTGFLTMQDIFICEKTGLRPDGKVCGRFRATGIRPKCSDRLAQSGFRLPADMFEHTKVVG